MGHWSANTLFLQLPIDYNMDVRYEVKHNLYMPWNFKLVRQFTSANMMADLRTILSEPSFLDAY